MLGILSGLGLFWKVLLLFLPLFALSLIIPIVQAIVCASQAVYPSVPQSQKIPMKLGAITGFLHLMQPIARLWGRMKHGLAPWRKLGWRFLRFPTKHITSVWSESWKSPEQWLELLETVIQRQGAVVQRGGDFDTWDLRIRGGVFSSLSIRMALEEHGGGKQMAKLVATPRCSLLGGVHALMWTTFCIWALLAGQWVVAGVLFVCTFILVMWLVAEAGYARNLCETGFGELEAD